jgi:flagellar basal body-associated protein FliL
MRAEYRKDKKATALVLIVLVVLVILVAMLVRRWYKKKNNARVTGGGMHELLPAGDPRHTHMVDIDQAGSGVSTEDEGHRHAVEGKRDIGLALPDGEVGEASHTHDITQYIVNK